VFHYSLLNTSNMASFVEQPQFPQFDQNGIPICEPTICIPRVFPNISDRRIFAIFRELRVGFVEKIDMVPREGKDGKQYNMVFVKFRNWFVTDEASNAMRERLLSGEQVKIVYDESWFWKVSAHQQKIAKEPVQNTPRKNIPFVDFEFREVPVRNQKQLHAEHKASKSIQRTPQQSLPRVNIYEALCNVADETQPETQPEEGEWTEL
jgi:hypothetical protein